MKKLIYVLIACLMGGLVGGFFSLTTAQEDIDCSAGGSWKCYQNAKPMDVLNDLVKNEDTIATQLDRVEREQGQFNEGFLKSADTFDSVRQNIDIYLQWAAFLGLSFAVIFIIYNGILLMFTPLNGDQVATVKKRMMYIAAGIVVITGFYFILKIFLSIFIDVVVG